MTVVIHSEFKGRTLADDMTESEFELFNALDIRAWGEAEDAAQRGALYLDRVLPAWYTTVKVLNLDLSSPCQCVLGQIFTDESARITELRNENADDAVEVIAGDKTFDADFSLDGYGFGIRLLDLHTSAEHAEKDGDLASASEFFGFDHTERYRYSELTDAWQHEILTRVAAAQADRG